MTDNNTQSEHKDHILPVKMYLTVGAVLFFLTIVTVAVSRFDFGQFNLIIAMIIAIIKASIVGLFFMHLLWDRRFYMSAMLMSVLFLGVFIIITMSDTMRRGDIYEEVRHPIVREAAIYKNIDKSENDSHSGDNHDEAKKDDDEDQHAPTH
jgi:cytochrome c oxidase subunit 4